MAREMNGTAKKITLGAATAIIVVAILGYIGNVFIPNAVSAMIKQEIEKTVATMTEDTTKKVVALETLVDNAILESQEHEVVIAIIKTELDAIKTKQNEMVVALKELHDTVEELRLEFMRYMRSKNDKAR